MEDALLGSELGRYRLERVLGEGGMGRVYLGVQPAIGSRVAIKVLSAECTRQPELLERFFAEARAVNLIRHEHIVSVLDLSRLPDGRPYIVMEFIEGQTLAQLVRREAAPLGGIVQVVGEVLGALQAAHAIGIVHRDLKPDNVLVTNEGHAKVLDFGIAKLAPGLHDQSPRTATGALMGTPAYMAPEQISGADKADARTDVYAAGVLLFEAVTGHQPFTGATMFDVMRAHIDKPPPSARALRPDLPEPIEHVIFTALSKDPAARFQSAAAMAQALGHASSTLRPDQWIPLSSRGAVVPRLSRSANEIALHSTAVAPPPTAARRRRTGLIVAALATLAIVGGLALLLVGRSSAPETPPPPPSPSPSPSPSPPPSPSPSPVAAAVPDAAAAAVAAADPVPAAVPAPKKPSTSAKHTAPPIDAGTPSVIIGPNVHIGSNVIIGSNPPPAPTATNTASRPADYDPRHFDPISYLPTATSLAQQLAPDAHLTRFEFDPVYPDGHVDLTSKSARDHEYDFRSPSRSARPADVPRNVPVDRPCMIHVEVTASSATATIRNNEDCNAKLVRAPRCHFAGVWKQAAAAGTSTDNIVARIAWLSDEQWFFDIDLEGHGGGVSTFPDRCP